jgi:hypothetical protein
VKGRGPLLTIGEFNRECLELRKRWKSIPEVLAILDQIERDTGTAGSDYGIPHVAELARKAKALLKG